MSKSLQQQLLKKGLIDSKKANAISSEKRKALKQQRKQKTGTVDARQATAQYAREQARLAQQARDRELNRQRQELADKKAVQAQIIQLVDRYKLDRDSAGLEYNFSDQKVVRKILVTPSMSKELSRGRLCIARIGESCEVIPRPIADKIRERDAAAIVVDYETGQDATDTHPDDDYYAQFEIPDDLIW